MVLEPSGEVTEQSASGGLERYCGPYRPGITAPYALLADALLVRNQVDRAIDVIERGLSICVASGETFLQAEFYRLKARAWQSNGSNAGAEAECLLDRAITISRNQGRPPAATEGRAGFR